MGCSSIFGTTSPTALMSSLSTRPDRARRLSTGERGRSARLAWPIHTTSTESRTCGGSARAKSRSSSSRRRNSATSRPGSGHSGSVGRSMMRGAPVDVWLERGALMASPRFDPAQADADCTITAPATADGAIAVKLCTASGRRSGHSPPLQEGAHLGRGCGVYVGCPRRDDHDGRRLESRCHLVLRITGDVISGCPRHGRDRPDARGQPRPHTR